MSRRSQLVLGFALSAVFVWLFLRQADLSEVGRALLDARPLGLVVAIGLTLLTALQRAWRWRLLLRPLGWIPVRPLLETILMGWAVTTVLPGRLGEVARPVLLSRRADVSASAAFGSVVLERIFDATTVLALLAFYLAFLPAPTSITAEGQAALEAMRSTGMLALTGLLVGGVLAILAMRSRTFRRRMEGWATRFLPGNLGSLAIAFLEGMSGLRSPWLVARIAASSLVLWGTILGTYVVLFRAFDLALPWYASIPLLALLVVGVMIPTPGGMGSFHKAAQIGLVGLWGVNNELAVAYAIVSHAAAFLTLGALGLVLLVREGLSPAALSRIEAPAPAAGTQEVALEAPHGDSVED